MIHAYWTEGRREISGLSDLRVERIEGRDRHPAPVRVAVLSNEVSVFDATGSPTLQRQDFLTAARKPGSSLLPTPRNGRLILVSLGDSEAA